MASTIRVRAVASGDTTEVQSLIQHPMDSGFVKDAKGELIPPHHIEVVQFEHGGKTVFTALWGPAVSKDPYLKFSFKGGQEGRRPQSELGRQQGRIRFIDGQNPISGRKEPEREDFKNAAQTLSRGRLRRRRGAAAARRQRRQPAGRLQGIPQIFHRALSQGAARRFRQRPLFDGRGPAQAVEGDRRISAVSVRRRQGQGDVREAVQERQDVRRLLPQQGHRRPPELSRCSTPSRAR